MTALKHAGALFSGVSILAIAASASAQTAGQVAAAAAHVEEVVVTGSRVITNGNNSPTPVTVVPVDDLLRVQPTTMAEALNTLPVFSGSRGQLSNPNTGTTIQTGGGNSAGNYLNLRNLGAVRTLILFDGHRVPPTSANGIVDVDMVPQQLLQRVDVVTGGASAVYGSDAVSGVVNFVTDRRFEGVKASFQHGATEKGDDRSYDFGIAAGEALFGGRGHIEGSYEFRYDGGVPTRSSRDPNHLVYSIQGAGTAANPFYLTPNARVTTSTFGGLINLGILNGQTFNQNGVLSPFTHGAPSGTAANEIGGDGIYYDTSLKSGLRSHQIFGRFDYDVTDDMHAYLEAAGNEKLNTSYYLWQNLNNVTLSATGAYLAPAYQAQLAAAKQTTFRMSKQMMDVPRFKPTNRERQIFLNGGISGELGDGYKWDLGFVHSTSKLTLTNTNNMNNGRLYASLDAVKDASGNIVCSVTVTNPGLYPGCSPLNPFGPASDNPAVLQYIEGQTSFIADTQMDDVSGSVSGSPFADWAGPVSIAVSGEWRRLGYTGSSTARPTDLLNCTGLRFNCTATSVAWNNAISDRSPVSQTVSEGAVEIDAPILKDLPFAQSFSLNGAARYTSYSTSGDYTTWKIGADWHVDDEIRLRGTRSRDIRAPTLDDLFAPTTSTVGTGNFQDPLTNAAVTGVVTVAGGNPGLTAEQGDTWTGGVVYTPMWLPGLSLTADYFNITVSNSILPLLATNVTVQRACVNSGGTSPYCQLYVRPFPYSNTSTANNVTMVFNKSINISEQDTNGVDFEANYATQLLDRPASIRWLTTYQPQILYIQPTVPTLNQAGAAFGNGGVTSAPVWRVTAFFRYSPFENFNVDIQTRWRTSLNLAGDPTLVFSGGKVPSATFTSLAMAYQLESGLGQTELFMNISNLFNAKPPPAAAYTNQAPGQQTAFAIYDDPLGRAFTVGLRIRP